jgi:hypothetical protein
MSPFTSSAPHITPEQETAEWEALTKEERQRVQSDIYGTALADSEESGSEESSVTDVTTLLREAIDAIPQSEKRDYVEAMKRDPDLVAFESPSLAFLECEKNNAWAAAKRLVFYWNVRVQFFGPDRAFLPMTLAGAMKEDVRFLEQGITMPLPSDTTGRPVFFFDRERVTASIPRESTLRCLFYGMQKTLVDNRAAAKRGHIRLINFRVSGTCLYQEWRCVTASS